MRKLMTRYSSPTVRSILSSLGSMFLIGLLLIPIGCGGGNVEHAPVTMPLLESQGRSYSGAQEIQAFGALKTSAQDNMGNYLIGPHDLLNIQVYGQEGLSVSTRVSGQGTIRFPMLGEMNVEGETERSLESKIEKSLADGYLQNPSVIVIISEKNARQVAILGQVAAPGIYPIFGTEPLMDVLARAGGVPSGMPVAFVIRNTRERFSFDELKNMSEKELEKYSIRVDLEALIKKGDQQWNVMLQAGDTVLVPEAGTVQVTGKGIVTPGTYSLLAGDNTLTQIIDNAGGIKFSADRENIILLRNDPGTDEEKKIIVNLRPILHDHRKDIILQPGDRIIVKEDGTRRVLAAIGKTLDEVIGISVGATYQYNANEEAR